MTVATPPEIQSAIPRLQPSGWIRYFSFSVDHKVIGLQYLVCGFAFYLVGGALAGAIRTELASPISDFMARDVYNQVLTLHGTVMIFLWIVPVVNGAFGNYLIPFYVGATFLATYWKSKPAASLPLPSWMRLASRFSVGPPGIMSQAWRRIFSDWRISSMRTL